MGSPAALPATRAPRRESRRRAPRPGARTRPASYAAILAGEPLHGRGRGERARRTKSLALPGVAEDALDAGVVLGELGALAEKAAQLLEDLRGERGRLVLVEEELHPLARQLHLIFVAALPVAVGASEGDARPVALPRLEEVAGERLAEVMVGGVADLLDRLHHQGLARHLHAIAHETQD